MTYGQGTPTYTIIRRSELCTYVGTQQRSVACKILEGLLFFRVSERHLQTGRQAT